MERSPAFADSCTFYSSPLPPIVCALPSGKKLFAKLMSVCACCGMANACWEFVRWLIEAALHGEAKNCRGSLKGHLELNGCVEFVPSLLYQQKAAPLSLRVAC